MPYRVINIYYSVTCYTNHINSTRIQSIASMALMVFPDAYSNKKIHRVFPDNNPHQSAKVSTIYYCNLSLFSSGTGRNNISKTALFMSKVLAGHISNPASTLKPGM